MADKKNWRGVMKILEVRHLDRDGNTLWEQRDVLNLLHEDGEEFLLRAAFTGGQDSTVIPENYYLGLDNRTTVAADDTMDELVGEPTSGGYQRQAVSSSGDFSLNFDSGHYVATSPVVAFRSTTASWGPVNNLFLTDADDDSGFLISTIVLSTTVTLAVGESVTMRVGMTLRDC